MRRIVALVFLLAMCLALPVAAGVGNNPNAESIETVACADGTELSLVIATGPAGHQPSGQLAGVAKSTFVLDGPDGNVLFAIVDGPGVSAGLDGLTTWCWWFDPTEGVWVGADILVHPSFR
jgi:hypothetical protein